MAKAYICDNCGQPLKKGRNFTGGAENRIDLKQILRGKVGNVYIEVRAGFAPGPDEAVGCGKGELCLDCVIAAIMGLKEKAEHELNPPDDSKK